MAQFNINVPDNNFNEIQSYIQTPLVNKINSLKSDVGTIVSTVSDNSNVPEQLIYTMMILLSNGKNNAEYEANDAHMRSGLFSLSNKVGKEILARERGKGRMNEAELSFLRSAGDANLNTFIADEKPAGVQSVNRFWKTAAGTGLNRISRTSQQEPINWTNAKIAIQTGAIWIGQVWDELSANGSKKPLDKVIITMLMPYGSQIQNKKLSMGYRQANSMGYMSGSRIVQHRPYNTDYTATTKQKLKDKIIRTPKVWIPSAGGTEDKVWEQGEVMGSSLKPTLFSGEIINPRGGSVQNAFQLALAKGGLLDKLTA